MAQHRFYSDALYDRNHREAAPAPAAGRSSLPTLRFLTCGSVDDGKSTLIGRLLFESQRIHDDHFTALERDSRRFGTTGTDIDFALLVDGLEDERRQGITIDVAYRFFNTGSRSFIVADTPGHEQYTRNMATGASQCDLAIILIDARKGVLPQTRRHATICAVLGIGQLVLAVNKIDLVGYDKAVYDRIVSDFLGFAAQLTFSHITPIPISARFGDNLTAPSGNMAWYTGPTLMATLDRADIASALDELPFRLPVQWVSRPNADFRGYAGTIVSGVVSPGTALTVAVSGRTGTVQRIVTADGDLDSARAGDAVTLVLDEDIDVTRGDLFVPPEARPAVADQFSANVIWMSEEPLFPGREYLMRTGMRTLPVTITAIKHKLDMGDLKKLAAPTLALNEIGVCNLSTSSMIAIDAYKENRATGSFILIDRYSNATLGAGMIDFPLRRATNIHRQRITVDKAARARIKHQKPAILWFTGLSGSGKSTVADLVERSLHAAGHHTFLLDGDNVRHGLNRDLGFTDTDRVENIRRLGEVAKLFVEAGTIVLCSFISPFAAERRMVRDKVEPGEFLEIFVDTPLEECIRRDPKGLYAKALRGEITNFTGIDSTYEVPEAPELHLRTGGHTAESLAQEVLDLLRDHGIV